jgi:outer membrane lipoprotein-sorting protein
MQVQRTGPLIALVAIALIALSSGGSAHADLFDDLYRRGQMRNGNLRTFTAIFAESTTSSLLTRPLEARGTVSVERPGRVALRYSEPDERTVIIDGDRMIVAWPSRGILQTKDIGASQRRVQESFVDGSPDKLRRHFQVIAREGAGGYVVTMVPTRKQIKDGLAELDLVIDATSLLMNSMKMTFPNGDTKTMTFTDVKPNATLDPAVFRVPVVSR